MMAYDISQTVQDGIERVVYIPKTRRFKTPIVMQHGMWHGAWCWADWQAQFAEWGWETHAHSLPGHAGSPTQRPIRWCTLGYYLKFLAAEVQRQAVRPVLMGHSMGGALTQWYLRKIGDDLPAAVLVAPWGSHDMLMQVLRYLFLDPPGFFLSMFTLSATPCVRSPESAARMLITEGARYTPEDLHARVGPESSWVLYQYNRLMWQPARNVRTPMLWLAGGADAVVPESVERRSAAHYGAEYVLIEGEGHNLMMEPSYLKTARAIHDWLVKQGVE